MIPQLLRFHDANFLELSMCCNALKVDKGKNLNVKMSH